MMNYKLLGCIKCQMSSTENKHKRKEEVVTSGGESPRNFTDKTNFCWSLQDEITYVLKKGEISLIWLGGKKWEGHSTGAGGGGKCF